MLHADRCTSIALLCRNWGSGDPINDTVAGLARRGYYAAVSFADHLAGMVLDELDAIGEAGNTVVLLTSDHGWQLGERVRAGSSGVALPAHALQQPRCTPQLRRQPRPSAV